MTLHEPATVFSDYILAAFAAWFAWRLQASTPPANRAARWLGRALTLTAGSAFIGGSYHGFAPDLPVLFAATWWVLTLIVICLVSAAMSLSLVHEFTPSRATKKWLVVVAFKLGVFVVAAIAHPKFVVVVTDYGLTLLAWAIAAAVTRRTWSAGMLAAIALSVVAATVQQMRWGPSPHFNHNDLYHVLQALALVGFYHAGRHLGHAPGN